MSTRVMTADISIFDASTTDPLLAAALSDIFTSMMISRAELEAGNQAAIHLASVRWNDYT